MLVYEEYFNAGVSIYISHITIFTFATAIIYIERSYANPILQVSMDRIIDIFGKRKNCKSFMGSVHVLIIL